VTEPHATSEKRRGYVDLVIGSSWRRGSARATAGRTKLSLSEVALQAGVSRRALPLVSIKGLLLEAFESMSARCRQRYHRATAGHGEREIDAALRVIVEYQTLVFGRATGRIEPEVVIAQLACCSFLSSSALAEAKCRRRRSRQARDRD